MAVTPESINGLATAVLACVCATLDQTAETVAGQPGCPCRSCVVPGTPAWDSCDAPCGGGDEVGGQLTVHVARVYPTSEFPVETRDVFGLKSCSPVLIAVELVITLLRCVPVADPDTGCPPSCEEEAAAARVIQIDSASVLNALLCCLPSLSGVDMRRLGPRFIIGAQRTVEPAGRCGGIEQRVTVALPSCGCPEEAP
ncbi:hypothetical protein [Streptomyces sp. AMCC400023]|uniref:hypothetical protein n=1 Tax=Streptomyces sp. AMCC400023 TaxID=2056258 RepID=UPI001F424882|nr:hypothetical protein [Streptomyces sp. AMCC400023]UJV42990.1 hypothetical protein CVT30_26905 [Streptomyces sp. AMCC400023]